MSDALPHVGIRVAGHSSGATITIDGQLIRGVFRYTLTHDAGPELPALTLELYPGSVTVDHPAAVLAALERTKEGERAGEAPIDEFAYPTRYLELERQAVAGTQLEGVDAALLAERYVALSPERRDAVCDAIGLRRACGGPITEAFALAYAAGKLKAFADAVGAALNEQQNGWGPGLPMRSERTTPTTSEGAE